MAETKKTTAQPAATAAVTDPTLVAALAQIQGSRSGAVQAGTPVWRPGYAPNNQASWPKANYNLNNTQVWSIVSDQFNTLEKQNILRSQLIQAGYLPKSAVNRFQFEWNNTDDTPAMLRLLEKANADGVLWNERLQVDLSAKQRGGTGAPSVQKYVNYSDPETAKAIVQSSFRALVGRDPNSAEYTQFTKALRAAEAASPTVITRTGNTQVTTGGLSSTGASQMLESQIMADDALETEAVNMRINDYADIVSRLAGA
jgi:hypothetical protein